MEVEILHEIYVNNGRRYIDIFYKGEQHRIKVPYRYGRVHKIEQHPTKSVWEYKAGDLAIVGISNTVLTKIVPPTT